MNMGIFTIIGSIISVTLMLFTLGGTMKNSEGQYPSHLKALLQNNGNAGSFYVASIASITSYIPIVLDIFINFYSTLPKPPYDKYFPLREAFLGFATIDLLILGFILPHEAFDLLPCLLSCRSCLLNWTILYSLHHIEPTVWKPSSLLMVGFSFTTGRICKAIALFYPQFDNMCCNNMKALVICGFLQLMPLYHAWLMYILQINMDTFQVSFGNMWALYYICLTAMDWLPVFLPSLSTTPQWDVLTGNDYLIVHSYVITAFTLLMSVMTIYLSRTENDVTKMLSNYQKRQQIQTADSMISLDLKLLKSDVNDGSIVGMQQSLDSMLISSDVSTTQLNSNLPDDRSRDLTRPEVIAPPLPLVPLWDVIAVNFVTASTEARDQGIELRYTSTDSVHRSLSSYVVKADPSSFSYVVSSMLANAIYLTPKGGMVLLKLKPFYIAHSVLEQEFAANHALEFNLLKIEVLVSEVIISKEIGDKIGSETLPPECDLAAIKRVVQSIGWNIELHLIGGGHSKGLTLVLKLPIERASVDKSQTNMSVDINLSRHDVRSSVSALPDAKRGRCSSAKVVKNRSLEAAFASDHEGLLVPPQVGRSASLHAQRPGKQSTESMKIQNGRRQKTLGDSHPSALSTHRVQDKPCTNAPPKPFKSSARAPSAGRTRSPVRDAAAMQSAVDHEIDKTAPLKPEKSRAVTPGRPAQTIEKCRDVALPRWQYCSNTQSLSPSLSPSVSSSEVNKDNKTTPLSRTPSRRAPSAAAEFSHDRRVSVMTSSPATRLFAEETGDGLGIEDGGLDSENQPSTLAVPTTACQDSETTEKERGEGKDNAILSTKITELSPSLNHVEVDKDVRSGPQRDSLSNRTPLRARSLNTKEVGKGKDSGGGVQRSKPSATVHAAATRPSVSLRAPPLPEKSKQVKSHLSPTASSTRASVTSIGSKTQAEELNIWSRNLRSLGNSSGNFAKDKSKTDRTNRTHGMGLHSEAMMAAMRMETATLDMEGKPSLETMMAQLAFLKATFVNSDEELEWLMLSKQNGAYKYAKNKEDAAEDKYYKAMFDTDVLDAKLHLLKGHMAQLPVILKDMIAIGTKYIDPGNSDDSGNALPDIHLQCTSAMNEARATLKELIKLDLSKIFCAEFDRELDVLASENNTIVETLQKAKHMQTFSTAEELRKLNARKALVTKIAEGNLKEMEKWGTRAKETSEYTKVLSDQEETWSLREKEANEAALRIMRAFIPNTELTKLGRDGLWPAELLAEVKSNKLLHWLVTHPDDIAWTSFLTGENRQYFENIEGLDVVELRALALCVPAKFELDGDGKKAEWRSRFFARTRLLVSQQNGDNVKGGWDSVKAKRAMVQMPSLKPEQARRSVYFYRTPEQLQLRLKQMDDRYALLKKKQDWLAKADAALSEAKAEYNVILAESRNAQIRLAFGADKVAAAKELAKKELSECEKKRKMLFADVSNLRRSLSVSPVSREQLLVNMEELQLFIDDLTSTDWSWSNIPVAVKGVFNPTPEIVRKERNSSKFVTAEQEAQQRRLEIEALKAKKDVCPVVAPEDTAAACVDSTDDTNSPEDVHSGQDRGMDRDSAVQGTEKEETGDHASSITCTPSSLKSNAAMLASLNKLFAKPQPPSPYGVRGAIEGASSIKTPSQPPMEVLQRTNSRLLRQVSGLRSPSEPSSSQNTQPTTNVANVAIDMASKPEKSSLLKEILQKKLRSSTGKSVDVQETPSVEGGRDRGPTGSGLALESSLESPVAPSHPRTTMNFLQELKLNFKRGSDPEAKSDDLIEAAKSQVENVVVHEVGPALASEFFAGAF